MSIIYTKPLGPEGVKFLANYDLVYLFRDAKACKITGIDDPEDKIVAEILRVLSAHSMKSNTALKFQWDWTREPRNIPNFDSPKSFLQPLLIGDPPERVLILRSPSLKGEIARYAQPANEELLELLTRTIDKPSIGAVTAIDKWIDATLASAVESLPVGSKERKSMIEDFEIQASYANKNVAGVTITGTLFGETFTVEGSARRAPGDRPDPEIGLKLATARALEGLAKRALRHANGAVVQADHLHASRHPNAIAARKATRAAWEESKKLKAKGDDIFELPIEEVERALKLNPYC